MKNELDQRKSSEDDLSSGPSARAPGVDEDQFDADEYVRQLIQRMGGSSPASAPPVKLKEAASNSKPATVPHQPSNADASSQAENPAADIAFQPTQRLTRAEEMGVEPAAIENAMRRSAPEKSVDLERLREAANITSHHDLHRFDCNGLVRGAYYNLFLSVVCMVLSLVLVGLSAGPVSSGYISSLVVLALSVLFAFRYTAASRVLWMKLRVPASEPR